jgi:DNA-directed RNA polymerase subunit RPC12/RpoP
MDSIPVPIELRCGKCGEKALIAEGDTLTEESMVSCTSCGAKLGKWGEVKQQALETSAEQIKKRLKDRFGDAFKPS